MNAGSGVEWDPNRKYCPVCGYPTLIDNTIYAKCRRDHVYLTVEQVTAPGKPLGWSKRILRWFTP